ncbi:UNVERIFIED_CONTAM: hypothetical protein K2H54_072257 [Gekko kuhli]
MNCTVPQTRNLDLEARSLLGLKEPSLLLHPNEQIMLGALPLQARNRKPPSGKAQLILCQFYAQRVNCGPIAILLAVQRKEGRGGRYMPTQAPPPPVSFLEQHSMESCCL